VPTWAIATCHGSHRVRACAFAVAAAVVGQALVHVFAALGSIVDISTWAVATFGRSRRVCACAFAVTAAVVGQARVHGCGSRGSRSGTFQTLRNRIGDSLRLLTLSCEEAAPSVEVECDALTHHFIHASLLTRRVVIDDSRQLVQIELALRHVALLVVNMFRFGGSFELFHSLRMRTRDILRVVTRCAEVAAPLILVVRDALALCVIHARLYARREVVGVARRLA